MPRRGRAAQARSAAKKDAGDVEAPPGGVLSAAASQGSLDAFSPLARLKALSKHYTSAEDAEPAEAGAWFSSKPAKERRRDKSQGKARTGVVVKAPSLVLSRAEASVAAVMTVVAAVAAAQARRRARLRVGGTSAHSARLACPQYVQRLMQGRAGLDFSVADDGLAVSELLLNASREWLPDGLPQRSVDLFHESDTMLWAVRQLLQQASSRGSSRGPSHSRPNSRPDTAGGSGSASRSSSHAGVRKPPRPPEPDDDDTPEVLGLVGTISNTLDFDAAAVVAADPDITLSGSKPPSPPETTPPASKTPSPSRTPHNRPVGLAPAPQLRKHSEIDTCDSEELSSASSEVDLSVSTCHGSTVSSPHRRLYSGRRGERSSLPPASPPGVGDRKSAEDVPLHVAPDPQHSPSRGSPADPIGRVSVRLTELQPSERRSRRSADVSSRTSGFQLSALTTPTSAPPYNVLPVAISVTDSSSIPSSSTTPVADAPARASPLGPAAPSTSSADASSPMPVPSSARPQHTLGTPTLPLTPPAAQKRREIPVVFAVADSRTANNPHPTTPFPFMSKAVPPPSVPPVSADAQNTAEFPFEVVTQIPPPALGAEKPAKKKFQKLLEKQTTTELKTPTSTPITPYREHGTFGAVRVRDLRGETRELSVTEMRRAVVDRIDVLQVADAYDDVKQGEGADEQTGADTEDEDDDIPSVASPLRPRSSRGGFSRAKRHLAAPAGPAFFFRGADPTSPGGVSPTRLTSQMSFTGKKKLSTTTRDKLQELMMHDLNECLTNYPLSPLAMTARSVARTPASPGTPGIYKQPGRERRGTLDPRDKKSVSIWLPGTPGGEEVKPMVLRARPGKASAFEMREPSTPQLSSPGFMLSTNPSRRRQLVSTPRVYEGDAESAPAMESPQSAIQPSSPVRVDVTSEEDDVPADVSAPRELGGSDGGQTFSTPSSSVIHTPWTAVAASAASGTSPSTTPTVLSAPASTVVSPLQAARNSKSQIRSHSHSHSDDTAPRGSGIQSTRSSLWSAPTQGDGGRGLDVEARSPTVTSIRPSPPPRRPPRTVTLGPAVDTSDRERELAQIASDLDMVYYAPRPHALPIVPHPPLTSGSTSHRGMLGGASQIQNAIQQRLWRRTPQPEKAYRYIRSTGAPQPVVV